MILTHLDLQEHKTLVAEGVEEIISTNITVPIKIYSRNGILEVFRAKPFNFSIVIHNSFHGYSIPS